MGQARGNQTSDSVAMRCQRVTMTFATNPGRSRTARRYSDMK